MESVRAQADVAEVSECSAKIQSKLCDTTTQKISFRHSQDLLRPSNGLLPVKLIEFCWVDGFWFEACVLFLMKR